MELCELLIFPWNGDALLRASAAKRSYSPATSVCGTYARELTHTKKLIPAHYTTADPPPCLAQLTVPRHGEARILG